LLALNFTWVLGFTSFLLGACLFPITLGIWWSGRDELSARRIAALAALLVLGYFCHLVSLGLTVLALLVLAMAAPLPDEREGSWRRRLSRLTLTSLSFIPLVALGFCYLRLARRGGPMHPLWENRFDPFSVQSWADRLGWVDPLTMAMKDCL